MEIACKITLQLDRTRTGSVILAFGPGETSPGSVAIEEVSKVWQLQELDPLQDHFVLQPPTPGCDTSFWRTPRAFQSRSGRFELRAPRYEVLYDFLGGEPHKSTATRAELVGETLTVWRPEV